MASFIPGAYGFLFVRSSGDAKGWGAYLFPKDSIPPTEAISFEQAFFDHGGTYLFAYGAPPVNTEAEATEFSEKVWAFLASTFSGAQTRGILWLLNPATPPVLGNLTAMGFRKSGSTTYGVNFQLNGTLTTSLQLRLGTSLELTYRDGGLQFEAFGPAGVSLASSVGAFEAVVEPNTAKIPFEGALAGCITYTVFIRRDGSFDALGLGCRFRFQSGNIVKQQFYPLIMGDFSSQRIGFFASNDLTDGLNLHNPLRTWFAFTGKTKDGDKVIFPTWYRTDYGNRIHFHPYVNMDAGTGLPAANSAMMLFQPINKAPGEDGKYDMVPQGDFFLEADQEPADQGLHNILCGLSGTENISFVSQSATQTGDRIRFMANQPAYAPVYPFKPSSLYESGSVDTQPLLKADYLTAWATLVAAQAPAIPLYSSMPVASPLYASNVGVGTSQPSFLGLLEPGLPVPQSGGLEFPMPAYAGLPIRDGKPDNFTPAEVDGFEYQIINPQRKQQITQAGVQGQRSRRGAAMNLRAGTAAIPSTTPQGLVATLEADGKWSQVQLARNQLKDLFWLRFINLKPELQNAFQTNQMMMVATEREFLGKLTSEGANTGGTEAVFDNVMSIQDWTMQVNTGNGNALGDYRNVILFKFRSGRLRDLVKNPKDWTSPELFNQGKGYDTTTNLAAVAQWIQEYFLEVDAEVARGNRFFEPIRDIIDSKTWNGILVLKVDLDLRKLPQEIQGLVAGIDISRFNAHHLGIEVNHVNSEGGVKMDQDSSLFGLISYIDPVYRKQVQDGKPPKEPIPPATGQDYDFKVLTLQVLFRNSAVKDFQSMSQITMAKLFADTVIQGSDQNPVTFSTVVLEGSYENQDGLPVYTFDSGEIQHAFYFDSNILRYLTVIRASFNTLRNQGSGADTNKVFSRFGLWGYLNFDEIPGLDVFSFGNEAGQSQLRSGLSFAGLQIDMNFDVETPTARAFAFNPSAITFDPRQSTPRAKSIYPNFALQLTSLVNGTKDQKPIDQGWLPVNVPPTLSLTKLPDAWYGLNMQLNLGTPGALVSAAGFNSSMLIAWGPGSKKEDKSYSAFIGIKLPGTSSDAKLLSLQGIFKVALGNILLGFDTERSSYYLLLDDIGVKIFGILKLPPGGSTKFFLFGNPDNTQDQTNLGWYAAYNKDVP